MPPLPTRDPRIEQHAPDPEDSCSEWEVARGPVLGSGVFPEDIDMTSRILPGYIFSYFERQDSRKSRRRSCAEDREEYLARDTRCRRIFAKICSSPPPSPSINTRNHEASSYTYKQSRRPTSRALEVVVALRLR
ncbi:hypothetical protein F511_28480 [Dorcoceras hygrometricum]|uniref:Uncharacterized protein n=1 Tax=Dorcoceras hygrometricum TaxID=472368 RepID=A0A2Z7CMU9_9LAMI|nr:hypothetical protein F511_28480 [Dorcoceras hygrometricum]